MQITGIVGKPDISTAQKVKQPIKQRGICNSHQTMILFSYLAVWLENQVSDSFAGSGEFPQCMSEHSSQSSYRIMTVFVVLEPPWLVDSPCSDF